MSLSEARAALVKDRVLDGVASVLASGEELTFARIAVAAEVPERTVYRHFPTRQALLTAVFDWINQRVDAERATTAAEAGELVRRAFPVFDEVAPVVRELLVAREGHPARLADNADRQAAALALVAHHVPRADATTSRRLAAVVQLLTSAAAWQALRDYWDLDGPEAAEASALAIELLLTAAASSSTTKKGRPR
jgi:AcrR family transcriptional regulator